MTENQNTKKWYEKEAECTATQKNESRRSSLLDVFTLRRKRLSVSDIVDVHGKNRGTTMESLSESGDIATMSQRLNFIPDESPPKKAKRILGISSPIQCINSKFRDAKAKQNSLISGSSETPKNARPVKQLAPLADLNDVPEDGLSSPEGAEIYAQCSLTVGDKVVSPSTQTPPHRTHLPYDKVSASCGRIKASAKSSPLATFGRSLSTIRLPSSRTFRIRMPSLVSLHTPTPNPSGDITPVVVSTDETTSTTSRVKRNSSSGSKILRVAKAIRKGLGPGSRVTKSAPRAKTEMKQRNKRRQTWADRPSFEKAVRADSEERISKKREWLKQFTSTVRILENEIDDLFTAGEPLYDAIVCDISTEGKAVSILSKKILSHVGEEVLEDLENELLFQRNIIVTESGNLTACKYIIFVVDCRLPGNVEKTWQDMRFAFYKLVQKAMEHSSITTLLLPWLFTGEPERDQDLIARTAIDSIQMIFHQMGFNSLTQLDIGGFGDSKKIYYEHYSRHLEAQVALLSPVEEASKSDSNATMDSDNNEENITPTPPQDGRDLDVVKENEPLIVVKTNSSQS